MNDKKPMTLSNIYKLTLATLLAFNLTQAIAEPISSKSLEESKIFGFHPYMNSIGTVMYRADAEGNRGVIDDNGKRVPTVGSIIGFKDLFCAVDLNNPITDQFGREWQPFFDYADKDLDNCNMSKPHKVEWFIIDTPDITSVLSWKTIEANAVSINQQYPDAIIDPKTTFTLPSSPMGQIPSAVPISGDVTSSVRVPEAAVGKYIGVRYTPMAASGIPIEGKAVEMFDLNYFYKQTPPSGPGVIGIDIDNESLITVKGDENNHTNGSGGGKVQPKIERPEIRNLSVSGIMSPGQTLTLAYDFIPYPETKIDEINDTFDKSVFFWGESNATLVHSEYYDERKTVEENNQLGSQSIRITQGRTVELTLADIGSFVEVTALPMRQATNEPWPVTGQAQTHELSKFSETITPIQRPIISNLSIIGVPKVGQPLVAEYTYTPSNSTRSYDASIYRWSYDNKGVDTLLVEGTIETDTNAIPDYSKPVKAPSTGNITLEQLGVPEVTTEVVGNVIRFRIDAIDGFGVTGNWAETNTAPLAGTPNNMFAIKLVEYEYGGTFPIVREYGKGFPSTGFEGATFRLFAENLNVNTNQANWNWSVVENSYYAKVDNTGMVTLLRIPPKDGVIRVIATNKADPKIIRSHSFSINKWLISIKELSNGPKGYNVNDAAQLCENFTRKDVAEVYLPSVPDYTSLPVDPANPKQSKGAHIRSAGWNTIYSFPSEDFYSQWGELDVYRTSERNQWSFPGAGTVYTWTRDVQEESNKPIFAAPLGWADWFVWDNGGLLLNTACIAYADDFIPEVPENIEGYMSGIKLPYAYYPQNNMGFPTKHLPGKGYPSLGFNGATFILFAQDGPGSPFFIANNTANNVSWQWQINDGEVAAINKPSKNAYAMVTYDGTVTLLALPPKGELIEITAKSGNLTRKHSFSLDKWLYSYADLNAGQLQTLSGAQATCTAAGYRMPTVNEYTGMPVDPNNAERSLGAGQRETGGWKIIYNFPSSDFYSQWGEFDIFYRYDVKSGIASQGVWPNVDYWSSSKTTSNRPIVAKISGWGDWVGVNNFTAQTLNWFACIAEAKDPKPPVVSNIVITPDLSIPTAVKLTAKYEFTKGESKNTADASTFVWYKNGAPATAQAVITESTKVAPLTLAKADVGSTFRLAIRAKDAAGISASTDTVKDFVFTRPQVSNLAFDANVNNLVPNVVLGATYLFSKGHALTTDASTYVWTASAPTAPTTVSTSGKVEGYTIKPADVGKVIKLEIIPIDNIGLSGKAESITTAMTVKALQAPIVSNVSITADVSTPTAVKLDGTYTYSRGQSSNTTDASTFIWYKDNVAVTAAKVVPQSGKVEPLTLSQADVNATFKLGIKAKDASGLAAATEVTKEFKFVAPQIASLNFDTRANTLNIGGSFGAQYVFTPGTPKTLDKSIYTWTGSTISPVRQITQTGTVTDYLIQPDDAGRTISLTVTPIDNIGMTGQSKTVTTVNQVKVTPPQIINLTINGTLTTGSALTATYNFVPGQSFDTRDASTYKWIGRNAAYTEVTTIRQTGQVDTYVIAREDSGRVITLEMTPKDVASATTGVIGQVVTKSVTAASIAPEVRNVKFYYYGGLNIGDYLGASYEFIKGSNDEDKSVTRLIKGSGNTNWIPNIGTGAVEAYQIQAADAGNVIKLEVEARDGAGQVGNIASTMTGLIAGQGPSIDSVSITAPATIRAGNVLKGTYRFLPGTNKTDASTFNWKGAAATATVQVPASGQVADYTVKATDVGGLITLSVTAKDGANLTGNTGVATTGTVLTNLPTVSDVKIYYFAGVKVGDKLGGSYRFTPGAINSDKSTFVWKGNAETTPALNTGSSNGVGSVGPYTIKSEDAGKTISLIVTAKDGTLTGNTAQDVTNVVPKELFTGVNFVATKVTGTIIDPKHGVISGKVTGQITWNPNGLICNVSDWHLRWYVDGVPMAYGNSWLPNAGGANCLANGLDFGDHMLIPLAVNNSSTNTLVTSSIQYELKYLPTGQIFKSNIVK